MLFRQTCDILQEHEWNLSLAAQLDEVGSLECGIGEQNAVVTDDANRYAHDTSETAHQGVAVELLELVEAAAVDDAREQQARIELVAAV